MLRQISGKEVIERDLGWLADKINSHQKVIVDLGCGDGLFAYRQAVSHNKNLYLAIDASANDLHKLSTKAEREGLTNLAFLQHAAEVLPAELTGRIDQLFINYPWGSLLEIIVNRLPYFTNALSLVKSSGRLEILLTYSSKYEESMMHDYQLPELTADVIKDIAQFLSDHSFVEVDCRVDGNETVKYLTSWGKRINSKRDREIWKIEAVKA